MKLLLLLEVSIELRDALKREFFGQSDELGFIQVFVRKLLNFGRVGRGEQANLLLTWHDLDNLFDDVLEVSREHLINFVNDEQIAVVKVCHILRSEIEDATRRSNDDMYRFLESVKVFADISAASADHALNLLVRAQTLDHKGGLHGQLTGRHEHECLDFVEFGINLLDQGNRVSGSLASSILSLGQNVMTLKRLGNCLFLNR